MIGAGVEYRVAKKYSLFGEPVLRYPITSINHNTPVKCLPYTAGLLCGNKI